MSAPARARAQSAAPAGRDPAAAAAGVAAVRREAETVVDGALERMFGAIEELDRAAEAMRGLAASLSPQALERTRELNEDLGRLMGRVEAALSREREAARRPVNGWRASTDPSTHVGRAGCTPPGPRSCPPITARRTDARTYSPRPGPLPAVSAHLPPG